MSRRTIQDKLKNNKVVTDYDEDQLRYLSTSIGGATYDYESDDSLEDNISEESEDEYTWTEASSSDSSGESPEEHVKAGVRTLTSRSLEIPVPSEESSEELESEEDEPEFTADDKQVKLERPTRKKVAAAKEPKKKAHWSDRITCKICGGEYTRSAVSAHRGTKKHQIYAKTNKKLLKIMRS